MSKTTQEKIAVMQAYEDGAEIESRRLDAYVWLSTPHPDWDWGCVDYRIKQTPKVTKYLCYESTQGCLWWMREGGETDDVRIPQLDMEVTES